MHSGSAVIQRRHVIYVEGYDPQGAEGYYGLFERAFQRFLKIWPLKAKLGPLELDSQDFAHWDIDAAGPNWQVTTRYDFLRQEHIIRANMAQPLLRQVPRALGWTLDYLVSGALFRVLRASWEFGAALIHFQMLLLWWLVLSAGGGWLVAYAATRALELRGPAGILIFVVGAVATFHALRPLANRLFVIQINSHWPYLCAFARGEATCFDAPIETCARRVVDAVRANEADEIVVVGHSGGGALAPAVIVRALELDPEVGRRGPPLVLLTLGSIAPGAALHPKATKLRAVFARLAVEPSVRWIDSQSRKDVLNFWDFDPVDGIGVHVGEARCNPLVWKVRFRDMLSAELYQRIRLNFFRLHYQFIMANDQRAPYDYFMLVCGPLPVASWAKDPTAALEAFAADASLLTDRVIEPAGHGRD
ncbi:MAG: hypothetical protein QOI40_2173 [Alphaproteobacteria bacterium]|nr:hypothetical protein [Alphaproteobacteria bacterium]